MNSNKNKIRKHLESVFRYRRALVIFNALLLLAAFGVLLFFPRTYSSEAKVWIKLGRENSKLDPTATTGKTISIQESDREDEIKSVVDVISSRGVITAAVESLGPAVVLGDEPVSDSDNSQWDDSSAVTELAKKIVGSAIGLVKMIDPISEKEEAIQEIIENIEVDAERKSNVVSVSFEADSPVLARAVVSAILEEYKKEHNRIHSTAGSRSFFAEQREMLQQRVAAASEKLADTKNELGIATLEGQKRILEAQIAKVQQAMLDTTQGKTEAEARIAKIKSLMVQYPEKVQSEEKLVPNTGRDSLRTRLYELQVQRMEMESKMAADHPRLETIRQQEEYAREELAARETIERSEKTESLSEVYQMLLKDLTKEEAKAAGLIAKLNELRAQEQNISDKISGLNLADIEVQRLQREHQLAVSSYLTYEENFEDARVDEALNQSMISNIGVAQKPTLQEKPVSPSKVLLGLITMMLMGIGSAAITAILPTIDSRVYDEEDLEAILGVPVTVSEESRFSQVLS